MLTVRELMRAGPLTLEPDESLRAAVDVLVESGTGGAPVVGGGQLVGVVSLSDVLAFEADVSTSSSYRTDLATDFDGVSEGVTMDDDERDEAGSWFRQDGESSDIASHLAFYHASEWDALDEHSVSEVMTRRVVSVGPDQSIQDAARVMDRAGVHRLVVTEHGELVGVLGARDIVRAVARGELVEASER